MEHTERRVWLAAVQARLDVGHVASEEAFASWVTGLARRAVADAPVGVPRLVAFPEAIGLALPFALRLPDAAEVAAEPDLLRAALRVLRRDATGVLRAAWRYRAFGPSAFFVARALPSYRAYASAFRAAARASDAVVVAGTAFLPDIEEEAARGVHVARPTVHNVAYTYAPGGGLLGRSKKVCLTPGVESRVGIRRGRVEDLPVMRTPAGRVAVAVCLDGWFDGVVSALDGRGAEVLVQPSANDAPWDRAWPPDPTLREGEAWLARGLRAGLQGRTNLRFALNPMLVGEFAGFRPRGRSSILANVARVGEDPGWADPAAGVVALADSADAEEVVTALVALG